jgi:hypothetical protein
MNIVFKCPFPRWLCSKFGVGAALIPIALAFTCPLSAQNCGGVVLQATCSGPLNLQFNPGLGLFAHTTEVSGSGQLKCVFLSGPLVRTANVVNLQGTGGLSCLFNGNVSGTMQFNWDDNTSSFINWKTLALNNFTVPNGQPVIIMTGTIVSGASEGDTVTLTYNDIPNLSTYLQCLSGTATSISGTPTGTISQPL